jgi:hypothetical protein
VNPGLEIGEIHSRTDDRIREIFKEEVAVGGAVAEAMVEEVIRARREIWGDRLGGECIPGCSYRSSHRLRAAVSATRRLTLAKQAKRRQAKAKRRRTGGEASTSRPRR